jgi:hypothetical protein
MPRLPTPSRRQTFEAVHCELSPHDTLLLFTDGLFEVEGPGADIYDYRRLVEAVNRRRHTSEASPHSTEVLSFKDAHETAVEGAGNGSRKPCRKVASSPGTGPPPEHVGEAARCRSRGRSNRLQRLKRRAGRHGAGNLDRPVRWDP